MADQQPAYAPDLNPVEGIWSVLKRGMLANLAVASIGHLVQVIRHGMKKIQYRPGLIDGYLAGTGLSLDQIDHPTGITGQKPRLSIAARRSKDLQARMLGDRPIRGTSPLAASSGWGGVLYGNWPEVREIA